MDEDRKYDLVINITSETDLSEEEQIREISSLFPSFDGLPGRNNELLSDYVIEQYAYARSIGMGMKEAAYAAEVSLTFIENCLNGEGLTLERFSALIRSEFVSKAQFRKEQLTTLSKASQEGDTKAAATLLEKIWPQHYVEKQQPSAVLAVVSNEKELTAELKKRGIPIPEIGVPDITDMPEDDGAE